MWFNTDFWDWFLG